MSGHYATLLRGTVEALLPYADVYIADWEDARKVPLAMGRFDLDDYVDYVIEMLHFLGPDTHVMAVCQPAVPVLMAVACMEAENDPCCPATMTLMGGPIDTRINPTAVNKLAMDKGIGWFRDNVIMKVPFPHAGFLRDVYPGFLQLSGFMSMNLDRHVDAHKEFFGHLVKNDGDSAEKHRDFYDEYMAVMDLTAEFYLQTVETVFITPCPAEGRDDASRQARRPDRHPAHGAADRRGRERRHFRRRPDQGGADALHRIPDDMRVHYLQPKVGHYGVFNGSRFRAEIAPRIVDFALTHGTTHAAAALPRKSAAAAARSAALSVAETVEDPMAMSAAVKAQSQAAPAPRAAKPAAAPSSRPAPPVAEKAAARPAPAAPKPPAAVKPSAVVKPPVAVKPPASVKSPVAVKPPATLPVATPPAEPVTPALSATGSTEQTAPAGLLPAADLLSSTAVAPPPQTAVASEPAPSLATPAKPGPKTPPVRRGRRKP